MFGKMDQQAPNAARLVEILAEIESVRRRLEVLADELRDMRLRLEHLPAEPRKLQSV